MKAASRILSIIACVIGIIGSVAGFFISGLGSGLRAASRGAHTTIPDSDSKVIMAFFFAFILTILGMVFSAVGNNENASRQKTLINGALLLVSGILATCCYSIIAGPIYAICGVLTVLAGATSGNR